VTGIDPDIPVRRCHPNRFRSQLKSLSPHPLFLLHKRLLKKTLRQPPPAVSISEIINQLRQKLFRSSVIPHVEADLYFRCRMESRPSGIVSDIPAGIPEPFHKPFFFIAFGPGKIIERPGIPPAGRSILSGKSTRQLPDI